MSRKIISYLLQCYSFYNNRFISEVNKLQGQRSVQNRRKYGFSSETTPTFVSMVSDAVHEYRSTENEGMWGGLVFFLAFEGKMYLHLIRHHRMKSVSRCLIKYHTTETYEGAEVQLHAYLTYAPDEVKWSASRPGRFTHRAEPRYPLGKRLGGPQSRFEGCGEEKTLCPCRESNPGSPVCSQSLSVIHSLLVGLL
jgi:hypothetical protein